jgi:hypothetical protein
LFPGRLPWFLLAIGPTNSVTSLQGPLSGVSEYARGFAEGFAVMPWAAVLATVLTLIAFARWRAFGPEGRSVFILLLTCTVLVIFHPNHQPRFLASWIFAVWVCTGIGAGVVYRWAARHVRTPVQRAMLAGIAVAILAVAMAASKTSWAVAAAYAHQTPGPSEFELLPGLPARLPHPTTQRVIGFLPDEFENRNFLRWNAEVRCRCLVNPDSPGDLRNLNRDEVAARLSAWTSRTGSDLIIGFFGPATSRTNDWLVGTMDAQSNFSRSTTLALPSHQAELIVWQRNAARVAP